MTVSKDIQKLKALIRSAAGKLAMDTAPTVASRIMPVRGKRSNRQVSGFYAHPGQPLLGCSVVDSGVVYDSADSQRKEQDAIELDVNDPQSYDGILSSEEREQLEVSLRALYAARYVWKLYLQLKDCVQPKANGAARMLPRSVCLNMLRPRVSLFLSTRLLLHTRAF